MYDALTTTVSTWSEKVLSAIDACIDDDEESRVARIVRALSQVSIWPHCPKAAELSIGSAPRAYRRIPLSFGSVREYEALLIVWPPDYATPIHDHDGLWGMEFVLDGVLEVESFQLSPQPPVHLTSDHTLVAGVGDHVAFSDADYAHRCRNLSRNRPALSLHVYGGALNTYRSFHHHEGQWSSQIHKAVREVSPT